MKAENYRIGNLVLAVGEVRKIDSLSIRQRPDCGYFGFDGLRPLKGIHIEPIPLTEEWLLKFGWLWNKECDSFEKYPNGDARMNLQFSTLSNSYTMFNFILSAEISRRIKYVHQLQNLFWCLTNEELTV